MGDGATAFFPSLGAFAAHYLISCPRAPDASPRSAAGGALRAPPSFERRDAPRDGLSPAILAARLQRDPSGGLATFATDDAAEAADAVAWACARENVAPEQLETVRRS